MLCRPQLKFAQLSFAHRDPHNADKFILEPDRTRHASAQVQMRHGRDPHRTGAALDDAEIAKVGELRQRPTGRFPFLQGSTVDGIDVAWLPEPKQVGVGVHEGDPTLDQLAEGAGKILKAFSLEGATGELAMNHRSLVDNLELLGQDGPVHLFGDLRKGGFPRYLQEGQPRSLGFADDGRRKVLEVLRDSQPHRSQATLDKTSYQRSLLEQLTRPGVARRQQ